MAGAGLSLTPGDGVRRVHEATLRVLAVTGESASRSAKRAPRERGIVIAPSAVFPNDDDHIRAGLGWEDLPHAPDVPDDRLCRGDGCGT